MRWLRFLGCTAALIGALQAPALSAGTGLPRVMSTNICADVLTLALADPAQILSLSRQSHDEKRFSMTEQARRFNANEGTAEDVVALQPQVVLASRRWQARHQASLFKRYGIRIVTVPFPTDWDGIFESTRRMGTAIGRDEAAQTLLDGLSARLAALKAHPRPHSALYLRPNGGSAGKGTHVDAVLTAAGLHNHATALGLKGWGRLDLEKIVENPPDLFVVPGMVNDMAYAKSALSRHPQLQKLLQSTPVVMLTHNDWGCSNWQLIEAAESIAAQTDQLKWPVRSMKVGAP